MKAIIFYIACILIGGIMIYRLISLIFLSKKEVNQKDFLSSLSNKNILMIGLGVLIISISSVSWFHISHNRAYVLMEDNTYIAHGKVKEVIFEKWEPSYGKANIEKLEWLSGKKLIYDKKGRLVKWRELTTPTDSCFYTDVFSSKFSEELIYDKSYLPKLTKGYIDTSNYSIVEIRFDKDNWPISGVELFTHDSTIAALYKYDRIGKNTLKKIVHDGNGIKSYEEILSFVKKNQLKHHKFTYFEDGIKSRFESFSYNLKGLKESSRIYKDEDFKEVKEAFIYVRDEWGNLNSIQYKSPHTDNDFYWSFEVTKFDRRGNWTELIWYLDGYPEEMFIRSIKYY